LRGSFDAAFTLDAYTTACEACVNVTHEHPYFFE
jgi:hypothetical protein